MISISCRRKRITGFRKTLIFFNIFRSGDSAFLTGDLKYIRSPLRQLLWIWRLIHLPRWLPLYMTGRVTSYFLSTDAGQPFTDGRSL